MRDLIAAAATPAAVSAISVVRLSGPGALECMDRVFRPRSGVPMSAQPSRKLVYGELMDGETVVDVCLCTVSRSPNSYTGEDTAELQLHGSPVVTAEALRLCFAHGARQALAGEFTKRAFLSGRMDLTQAEAVIDLIESETPEAARNAAGQLQGAVAGKADAIYRSLTAMASHFQAAVDWPEEDIPDFTLTGYDDTLTGAEETLSRLLRSFEQGKLLRSGAKCVILGKPNVGKSSLLNALAGYERVIVTPEAGTTRDTVEERLRIGGVLVRITDTAGIREAASQAESRGVERALEAAGTAQLVLCVFDGSGALEAEDERVLAAAGRSRVIPVISKADLPQKIDPAPIEATLGKPVCVSSVTGDGVRELEKAIADAFPTGSAVPTGEILTNARQADAVGRALESIRCAHDAARAGFTPDAVLLGLEEAMEALGELTGKSVRSDIADAVFSRFCVGK